MLVESAYRAAMRTEDEAPATVEHELSYHSVCIQLPWGWRGLTTTLRRHFAPDLAAVQTVQPYRIMHP